MKAKPDMIHDLQRAAEIVEWALDVQPRPSKARIAETQRMLRSLRRVAVLIKAVELWKS